MLLAAIIAVAAVAVWQRRAARRHRRGLNNSA